MAFDPIDTPVNEVTGIREVGGLVNEVTEEQARVLRPVDRGQVEGVVWDSTRSAPLEGAEVFLSGTNRQGRSTARVMPILGATSTSTGSPAARDVRRTGPCSVEVPSCAPVIPRAAHSLPGPSAR